MAAKLYKIESRDRIDDPEYEWSDWASAAEGEYTYEQAATLVGRIVLEDRPASEFRVVEVG